MAFLRILQLTSGTVSCFFKNKYKFVDCLMFQLKFFEVTNSTNFCTWVLLSIWCIITRCKWGKPRKISDDKINIYSNLSLSCNLKLITGQGMGVFSEIFREYAYSLKLKVREFTYSLNCKTWMIEDFWFIIVYIGYIKFMNMLSLLRYEHMVNTYM